MKADHKSPVIGLALGSGSARGWSHIGIILELEAMGIHPQVVAGTSVGALVGGVYVSGQLEEFADWVSKLTVRDVVGLMDFTFSGGFVKGERLFGFFNEHHRNPNIEELEQKFVSVATEMQTGREIWITKGPVWAASRASCAIPGLFTPVKHEERWMLDGGLVNPVPVSACRALGADIVIAVNLNAQLVGSHMSTASRDEVQREAAADASRDARNKSFWQKVVDYLQSSNTDTPSFFDAVASSVNIMQDRLTRSRMAGDPPEITLIPHLDDFALMDFHRAGEAIEEGRRLVRQHEIEIRRWTGVSSPAELPPPGEAILESPPEPDGDVQPAPG
ncbi:patatin-like phospholipase RssA [Solimonas marina]|uniref:Patatin-like phospholipase RssA n=1 Tax=Solimonas marina TaxID=2714601 RepID=A0A969WB17_9GAMM|nr:patatin-like phospholipase RssA [Solimonas marina]NKF23682.1 patatin-like phospholipase RssA [Solimonas marina]